MPRKSAEEAEWVDNEAAPASGRTAAALSGTSVRSGPVGPDRPPSCFPTQTQRPRELRGLFTLRQKSDTNAGPTLSPLSFTSAGTLKRARHNLPFLF